MRSLPLFCSFAILLAFGVIAESAEPKRDRYGDPLPQGAIARLGSLRFRHASSVQVVGFSLDGKTLSAYSGGGSLTCWDTASGWEARFVPVGSIMQPGCFRLSVDGKSLILADWHNGFRILDAVSGAERLKLEPQKLDRRYLDTLALAVSRDGRRAAAIYYQDTLVIWDLAAGKRLREMTFRHDLQRGSRDAIALTPDGKHLVLPHTDGSLYLLDVQSGKEVLAFEMPTEKRQNGSPIVKISPDGRYLAYGRRPSGASGSPNNSIALCDMTTGKRLRELSSKEKINEWVFTPDSRSLALSDADAIRIFDVSSGKETKTLHKPKGHGLVFSPDGRKLAAAFGTCIFLWDVAAGKLLHSPIGHDWFIREIHFFPDGKRLVSNTSGDMIVWDVLTSRLLSTYRSGRLQQWFSPTAGGDAIQFLDWELLDWQLKPSPRRKTKTPPNEREREEEVSKRPSGTEIRKIYRWDLASDRKEQQSVFSIPAACDWFALSPDGRRVASVILSAEPRVFLSDARGDKPAAPAVLPDKSPHLDLKFSPDGRRLLIRSWHGALRVLDSATGQLVRDLKPDSSGRRINATMVFSPDGRSVVLNDGRLCIREVASGKDRLQMSPANQFGHPVLSPNGRFLASYSGGGNDDSIRVFSTATGKLLAQWWGDQNRVTALAFSPDSRLLASGGYDGTILLWKLPEEDGLPANLSKEEAAAFWQTLADEDAARANRALAGLAAAPAQAVPLIKERFPTAWKKLDDKQIARLIAELDDDAFKVRERAMRQLSEVGFDAAGALRRALAEHPSVEAKKRMEDLLNRLIERGDPERLRCWRALEVLERIGTPQAKNVLRELAGKTLPADLRDDIRASLRRLGERP